MNANIFDIKPFAVHDGPGIRTTVFFKGCPLKCKWCHNPEGIGSKPQLSYYEHKCVNCGACAKACCFNVHSFESGSHELNRNKCTMCGECVKVCFSEALKIYGTMMTVEEVAETVMKDEIFYRNSGGGLTVSGGEPLLQSEFVNELFSTVKKHSIHTAVDTCGSIPRDNIDLVIDNTDIFLYDLKHADPEQHKAGTGRDNMQILENLLYISECGKNIEVRIPLIPGYNDNEENLNKSGKILKKIKNLSKTVVLPYHDFAKTKYNALNMKDTMPEVSITVNDRLNWAVNILKGHGINAKSGRE